MNKLKIISKRINFALLFLTASVLVSSTSCKKGVDVSKTDTVSATSKVVSTVSGADTYGALIKANTTLIGTITSNVTTIPYAGVEETKLTYTNPAGSPMAMFFFTVDLSQPNVTLEAANPNNGTDLNAKQTVTGQITAKNASSSTSEVIGAVNGDYWRVSTTETDPTPLGQPYGMVVKKGVVLKPITKNGAYYYFSIQQNLSAYIGSKGDSFVSTVREGSGGRYLLVENGVEKPDELGYNLNVEPRTAVGTLSPTKVVFIVVDGRSATYSQGLTMRDLAKVFKAIGATYAVNMDGGGSSTFVAKTGTSYTVKNRPSDGSQRSVANAWTIMGKKLAPPAGIFETFTTSAGRFNTAPTYSGSTVGIATTSTASHYVSGSLAHLKVTLNDNTSVTTPWFVRLLSGTGVPANNVLSAKTGTLYFYMKTTGATAGSQVRLWVDDSDGIEQSPLMNVISDNLWHKYTWNLPSGGVAGVGGNGVIDASNVTLDAIILTSPNRSTAWTCYIDDVGN